MLRFSCALFLAGCLLGCQPPPGDATGIEPSSATLTWGPCLSRSDGSSISPALRCTTIEVPLDHQHPDAAKISLRVGRHRSPVSTSAPAVFYLAGGPGQSSVEMSGALFRSDLRALSPFDLVFVDQRGTGGSGCALPCPDDPAHYLTVDAAHDLEWVRKLLGYDRIYLLGDSYGTRLGLELMRQHGDAVVAAVLDGMLPPDVDAVTASIRLLDRGVEQLVADCQASPRCQQITTDLLADLRRYRQKVRDNPRLRDPIYPAYAFEDERVYLLELATMLRHDYLREQVPRSIHEATLGHYAAWDSLCSIVWAEVTADPLYGSPFALAPGLHELLFCTEQLPNVDWTQASEAAAGEWARPRDVSDWQLWTATCSAWGVPALDPSLRAPVRSDTPVLLLSGAADLNVDPAWAAHAALSLGRATQLLLPNFTHCTAPYNDCVNDLVVSFLSAGATGMDTSCLSELVPPAW